MPRLAVGDTPSVEVDVFKADGITPATPTGATLTLTNLRTGQAVSTAGATITINANGVSVTLAAAAATGQFRLAVHITVDAVPTVVSTAYDYSVVAASEAL